MPSSLCPFRIGDEIANDKMSCNHNGLAHEHKCLKGLFCIGMAWSCIYNGRQVYTLLWKGEFVIWGLKS